MSYVSEAEMRSRLHREIDRMNGRKLRNISRSQNSLQNWVRKTARRIWGAIVDSWIVQAASWLWRAITGI